MVACGDSPCITKNVKIMSKEIECKNLVDFEQQFEQLQEEYSHVEFIGWRDGGFSKAEVYCV